MTRWPPVKRILGTTSKNEQKKSLSQYSEETPNEGLCSWWSPLLSSFSPLSFLSFYSPGTQDYCSPREGPLLPLQSPMVSFPVSRDRLSQYGLSPSLQVPWDLLACLYLCLYEVLGMAISSKHVLAHQDHTVECGGDSGTLHGKPRIFLCIQPPILRTLTFFLHETASLCSPFTLNIFSLHVCPGCLSSLILPSLPVS